MAETQTSGAVAGSASKSSWRWLPSRWAVDAFQRRPFRNVFLLGAVTAFTVSNYQRRVEQAKAEAEDAKTKKVLVLPFYKMKIVEESKVTSLRTLIANPPSSGSDRTVEMSIDEVVDLIHKASKDPQIVALYGILGHGAGFSTGGWAHVEELRNALLVFQQSHRRHHEANRDYLKSDTNDAPSKPMYLYSNTFASPTPNGGADMKEYYLASAFTHIHLQPQGDLNLFGLHATNSFYRDFLAKYGITVHVWKHGQYKNFTNQFTHSSFNKAHAENVSGILLGIQRHVCSGMYKARYDRLKDYDYATFWKMVHHAGSLPASMAQRIGFVDYLPPFNPLNDLLSYRRHTQLEEETGDEEQQNSIQEKNELQAKWNPKNADALDVNGPLTDLEQFPATKPISIMEYSRKTKEKESRKDQMFQVYERLEKMPSGMKSMMNILGFDESEFDETEIKGRKEQIAVLKIEGPITDSTARKLEQPLRQLKKAKDKVKAVVIRVDSPGGAITACENIHQQLQDLPQKVVVSFGNVSASGGYYISANSERIFASPTTITGSIGVLMLRADLRGLAQQWGVTFDSIATSELSGSYDPFYPINGRMKDNFANFADRAYLHFKQLVSNGRKLDMDQVETVAQGRVWTGEQAKQLGLVDELGGLNRAIAYCQRNYTDSGNAKIVAWPPKKTLLQAWMESRRKGRDEDDDGGDSLDNVEVPSMLVSALLSASRIPFLRDAIFGSVHLDSTSEHTSNAIISAERMFRNGRLPAVMSGMMLTIDENTAVRCLLQDNNILDVPGRLPPGFWEV